MTKTDKFLYGGFAVIIIGGIVAMLVSVFSPPKQLVEEIVETPEIEQPTLESDTPDVAQPQIPDGYVGYYLDDEGNKVYVTQEQIDAGKAYGEELKRKEAERIAQEKAKEKAEEEWWESRQKWVERFPFKPTHHPEVTFDPNAFHANEEMRSMVQNHGFLRNFYESRLPYTEEFEQMYNIVKEEVGEKAENTIVLGWTFNTLLEYHKAKAHNPNAFYKMNTIVTQVPQNPPPRFPDMLAGLTPEELNAYIALPEREKRAMTAKLRSSLITEWEEKLQAYENSFQTQIKDITWGEEAENLKESILGALTSNDDNPNQLWIPVEQALAIRDRLINEIPAEGFFEMGEDGLYYVDKYERELKSGDRLLIK